jgi:hypothetical protein
MTSTGFARVATALEFLVALGTWVLGACVWWLAGAVMTGALIIFLLTFERYELCPFECDCAPESTP